MAGAPGVQSLSGGMELLERAISYTVGTFGAVTPDVLTAATPCREWSVQDLLDHLNDGMSALGEAFDNGWVHVDADLQDRCPLDVLRESARALLAIIAERRAGVPTVDIDGREIAGAVVAVTGALELAVHGWDLAQGCGAPRPLPDGLAADLLRLAPLLVTDEDRPGRFADPVPVPAASSSSDRLLAWLGREP